MIYSYIALFGVLEIEYLGHIVSGQGVSMDNSKVQAILQWPPPNNVKQLRGFLGLTGYYRRFIKAYARIAAPLTELLKKDGYLWTDETEIAFLRLKEAMMSAPVLGLPNFQQPFILETDASGVGIGAVLHQNGHPIAYFSKKLAPRTQKKSAYFREMLAIAEAIAKFRHYLLGHRFVIRTDQKSLRSLMDQSLQTPEQQEWLHKFLGYDFTIEYKPGKDNLAADALSRVMTLSWSEPENSIVLKLKEALQKDPKLQVIMQQCVEQPLLHPNYSVKGDLLYRKDKIVVPMDVDLRQHLLQEFHSSPIGGHSGITRTMARMTEQFYWPDMKQDVQKYVQSCAICQQAKTLHTKPAGLLQPLPIPSQVWEDISMDFITRLPNSYGFNTIMVVVDRLSKYGHFIALKGDYTSKSVAELFKYVEMFLRCFTFNNPKAWYKALSWAEFWYNTSFHTSIGMTPFKALYGRDPPALIRYTPEASDPVTLQEQLTNRDRILQQLKQHLERAQVYMKNQADKKRIDVSLEVGDLVLVKLQPYRQHSVTLRRNQKLGMRYFGPFPVTAKIGKVAYKLQLPDEAKIHPVFHISQLKPFKGVPHDQYMPLPLTTTDTSPIIAPVAILQTRSVKQGSSFIPQVLVQWENTTPAEATWENFNEMLDSFPNLNLEDKVVINGDGIAMNENREITFSAKSAKGDPHGNKGNHAVSIDPGIMVQKKGMRKRVTSSRLRDYVHT